MSKWTTGRSDKTESGEGRENGGGGMYLCAQACLHSRSRGLNLMEQSFQYPSILGGLTAKSAPFTCTFPLTSPATSHHRRVRTEGTQSDMHPHTVQKHIRCTGSHTLPWTQNREWKLAWWKAYVLKQAVGEWIRTSLFKHTTERHQPVHQGQRGWGVCT